MIWEDALNYAENFELEGHTDWRLPNTKELQSILDYTRAPSVTNSAAIDPVFNCSELLDEGGNVNYPFYWTGTTHASWQQNASGSFAAYVCFGKPSAGWKNHRIQGIMCCWMFTEPVPNEVTPKPVIRMIIHMDTDHRGDVIRIFNYVRLVRDADTSMGIYEF